MDEKEIVTKLCKLCTEVNEKVFHFGHPTDCFCQERKLSAGSFSPEILNFIITAVKEKMPKE